MTKKNHRIRAFRIAFYASFAAFVAAVSLLLKLSERLPFVAPVISSPADKMSDLFLAMTNIITSFSTGLLGALGFLLVSGPKVNRGPTIKWFAFASGFFAAISTFLGYMVYEGIFDMLQEGMFGIDVPRVMLARYGQFYTFLLAFLLFGDFAIQSFEVEGGHENQPKSAVN